MRYRGNSFSLTPAVKGTNNLRSTRFRAHAEDRRVQRALDLIQSCYDVPMSEIVTSLNLSVSRFRHLFKREVGLTPGHFVKLVRLERAKKLLKNSFLTVKEIAAFVGANDVSHFVRDYKAAYGHTPSQARKGSSHRLQQIPAGTKRLSS
jgi:AraC-like DNA-binding protein